MLDFCYQPTPWPAAPAALRPAMEAYYAAAARLADGLLAIFGRALGLGRVVALYHRSSTSFQIC